jgi:hypothetical protein
VARILPSSKAEHAALQNANFPSPGTFFPALSRKEYTPGGQKLQINPSQLAHPTRGKVSQGFEGAGLATGASVWILILWTIFKPIQMSQWFFEFATHACAPE